MAIWSFAFTGAVVFAGWILPALPPFDLRAGVTPPALPLANSWYFLPKLMKILFQQLLVMALVLVLAARGMRPGAIAVICAALFGAAHPLLVLGGTPWGYVIRFTDMASLFGLAFPYLLLRVPMGLALSYMTQWSY